MKNFTKCITSILIALFISSAAKAEVVPISGYITADQTWTSDKVYLLVGFVYVTNGATLNIEAGTLVKGDKPTKGTLIITRGAKINASGTADAPIVFTSNGPVGFRTYGDWGGLLILGKASINQPGGEATVEGGVEDGQGNGTYGGGLTPDDNDNSGVLRYVRVEFSGIAFSPNNETNGITLAGVGAGTTIEYVQVSYCGDDSYEFFGGTVNAKYLVAFRGLDDEFDTDNGYRGKLQFLYGLRDPNIADVSGSNGFESDNDATGSVNAPQTAAIISNVTLAGPKVTSSTTINANYKRGAHLRRNTRQSIYNSIIMGYTSGIMIDGSSTETNANNDLLQIHNTILSGNVNNFEVSSGSSFDISGWFNNAANGNSVLAANIDVMLTDPFNLSAPNPVPMGGSPALTGAGFSDPNLMDPFFTNVSFKGAFGTVNWMDGWTNFNPQSTGYTTVENIKSVSSASIFPNPMKTTSTLSFSMTESDQVRITIADLSGREISEVLNSYMAAGKHDININVPGLNSGMYLVVIHSNENSNRVIKLSVE